MFKKDLIKKKYCLIFSSHYNSWLQAHGLHFIHQLEWVILDIGVRCMYKYFIQQLEWVIIEILPTSKNM